MARLEAEDAYAANRLALFRAKTYARPSGTAGVDTRLGELERIREGTQRRLREARAARRRSERDPPPGA